MISPVLLHTVSPHRVEFGTTWNTWVEATDVQCTEYSEGAGQVVGDAKLIRYLGRVAQPGAAIVTQTLTDRMGQYVRISLIESGTPVPVWWGVVTGDQLVDDGASGGVGKGTQFLTCAGIVSVLGQITIQRGIEGRYTSGSTPAAFINPGYLPPFNALPRGDKETNSTTIDSATVYPHRRWAGPTELFTEFTASAMLSYLLHVVARGAYGVAVSPTGSVGPSGPMWDYSDVDIDALGFALPNLDLNGMSVLDAINTIINPRRGLIWRSSVHPTTGVITVQVRSISASSITASTYYTLPAASSATAINLATDAGVSDLQVSRDASSCYDVITVCGARSWHALTLAYSRAFGTDSYALTDGWLSADETALNSINNIKDTPKEFEDVYRRFVFRGEWTGRQWESGGSSEYGLPWVLTEGGDGAITADMSFGGTVATSAQPHTLELTRELPCGVGFTDQPDGDRQPPLMFFVHGTDLQSWNGEDTVAPTRLQIDSNPPSITVSPANQPDLSNQINDSGSTLLFTVGIRAGRPLTYRWARAAGSRPRDVARSLVLNLPDCELWTVLPNTVTLCGENPKAEPPITGNTIHTTGATEIIVRDDRPQLQAALALLVAYYSTPSVSLNFTVRDEAAHDAWCQPGTLITTATLGLGAVTCNAVVTRRTINLTESGWGTTYSCERFIPDVESIR
jgi:hypothetical protein